MTATAHALVAGAIANRIGNPALAIPLAFCSHFVMDSIPHWDFGTNWRARSKTATGAVAIADTLLGLTVAYFLFAAKVPTIPLLITLIVSVLPDWMEAPWYIFFASHTKTEPSKTAGFFEKLTFRIYKLENKFHSKAQAPLGIITQIATVAFFMLLLK
jgi:hypothetical protein